MIHEIWQITLSLAPWLLVGMAITGMMHGWVPRDLVRKQLSGTGGVWKAVLVGIPLPLCSCGVIPAGIGLKKDGASDGASIGFLISTPQTGVDSLLVSAAFLGWPFAIFKVLSAVFLGMVGGLWTEWTSPEVLKDRPQDTENSVQDVSLGGMFNHALDVLRTVWVWLVVGILVSAAISLFAPSDLFMVGGPEGKWVAFGAALLISLPLYVCAMASVPVAAALVSSGLPVGAALIFLMAGPATNVATMGAVYRTFGKRTLGIYLGTIIGGSVLLGLVFDFVIPSEVAYSILEETPSTWWSVGSGLCLWLLLGWFALSDLLRAWRGRGWGLGEGSLQEFPVYGMTCGGCVSRIEHALSGVPGVDSVMVSLNPGLAQIQGTASEEVIEQAIREAGYTLHNPIGSD